MQTSATHTSPVTSFRVRRFNTHRGPRDRFEAPRFRALGYTDLRRSRISHRNQFRRHCFGRPCVGRNDSFTRFPANAETCWSVRPCERLDRSARALVTNQISAVVPAVLPTPVRVAPSMAQGCESRNNNDEGDAAEGQQRKAPERNRFGLARNRLKSVVLVERDMVHRRMGRLPTCSQHGLAFDPSVSTGCVLCRQATQSSGPVSEPAVRRRTLITLGILLVLTVSGVLLALEESHSTTGVATNNPVTTTASSPLSAPTALSSDPLQNPSLLPALEGALATKNESNRSGSFFLPERSAGEPLPVLVGLHGQGGDGASILRTFKALAATRHFAIVAPSSNYAAEVSSFTWTVGDKPNDVTTDFRHVKVCFDEVAARADVTLDRSRVLAVGFSGGASSAPYVATNVEPYTAFAVLHGGVFIGGIGPRRVRGWFSTGASDPARTPDHVNGHFQSMLRAGFNVVFRVYPGGHWISPGEADDVVRWWLGE